MAAMLGGFLYKRFMVGAKGWEQVPLYDMYREFGNLQAVGGIITYKHVLAALME